MLLQLFLPSISNFRLGSFSKGSNQWWVQCRFGCPNFVPKFSGQSQLTYSPRQKEILGIQCDRLISDFKGPKTIALVREKIRQIPDGSLSHCASALNLVFQKAFELRKKRRHPPWAKLRCSNPGCSWIKTPSRSRLLRQILPIVLVAGLGATNGCGYNGTGNYASCQGCGKVSV